LARLIDDRPDGRHFVHGRDSAEVASDVLERCVVQGLVGCCATVADENEIEITHVCGARR
jgi:hypothetical protein